MNLMVRSLNIRIETARPIDWVLPRRILFLLASWKVITLPHVSIVSQSYLEESTILNVVWPHRGSLSLALGCELRTLASLGRIVVGREEIISNWGVRIEIVSFVLTGRCVHFTVLNRAHNVRLIVMRCSRFQRRLTCISVLIARLNSRIALFREEIASWPCCIHATLQITRTTIIRSDHHSLAGLGAHKDLRRSHIFPSVWWWAPVANMLVLHWCSEVRIVWAGISTWWLWARARSNGCVVFGVRSLGCVTTHFCILWQI